MEAIMEVSKKITLIMNEEEARWLMGYTQNAMEPTREAFDREENMSTAVRVNIFNTLQKALRE